MFYMTNEEGVANHYSRTKKWLNGLLFILLFLFLSTCLRPSVGAQERYTGRKHGYITESMARARATLIVMPDYPEEAIRQKVAGVIKAKIEIAPEGDVIRATVQSGISPLLQEAVFSAVKQWKFKRRFISHDVPNSTWISRLTFVYVIEDEKARVEMYAPPPDAKPFDQLDGMYPPTELKEWQEWAAAYHR